MEENSKPEAMSWPPHVDMIEKCLSLGLIMRRSPNYDVTHPAVTLHPMPIRRAAFDTLCARQTLWNEAVDNTARNFPFLRDALRETAASDTEFTGRLLAILEDVYMSARPYQPLMLGILRTDYMGGRARTAEETAADWKNVEINTISCSFAGLAPLVSDFHSFLDAHRVAKTQDTLCSSEGPNTTHPNTHNNTNTANTLRSVSSVEVPAAMAAAAAAWCARVDLSAIRHASGAPRLRPVVVCVVQEGERNRADQCALLFSLLESHGILSLRRTLKELASGMRLIAAEDSAQPPHAVIDDIYVMAVAYFRSTYVPADFAADGAWDVRRDIERSSAVKCPSIPYHLLTFKKIQQLLCDVERVLVPIAFRGDSSKAQQLQEHFVPQYALNPAEVGEECVARLMSAAAADTSAYVLKPQLEGGGNLFAGEAMRNQLTSTNPDTRNKVQREYILMSRIAFPIRSGAMLVNGEIVQLRENMCSELGIFGTVLSDGAGVLRNAYAGHVVRSKPADIEDGGVMAGVAALDSLILL